MKKQLTVILLSIVTLVNAQFTPSQYIAYHTTDRIIIDGDEMDLAWTKVTWSNPFIDIEGVKTPTYNTQVKMLWDATYFYILAKLDEPHVWADIKTRDAIIYHNNDFEVFIDPDGDTHNYYELEINPLNTIWDLYINKPYREQDNIIVNDWTMTGLKSAIKVNGTLNDSSDIDKGWVIEMAIPWAVYKTSYFQNNVPKNKFWRVNFSRVNWDFELHNGKYQRKKDPTGKLLPEYNWVWSPMGVINIHEPEKWGYVYFSSKVAGEKDAFTIPKDETLKWHLYALHRAQNTYYKKHGEFAKKLKQLKVKPFVSTRTHFNIEHHNLGYNISVISPFTKRKLSIKEDGKFIIKTIQK